MPKRYKVSIESTYEPDGNNYLEWEDEYLAEEDEFEEEVEPRAEKELIEKLKHELIEMVFNGVKYNDLYDMVTVEVIEIEEN